MKLSKKMYLLGVKALCTQKLWQKEADATEKAACNKEYHKESLALANGWAQVVTDILATAEDIAELERRAVK